jgi:hypothetical protein
MCLTAADCPRRALIDGGGGVALALAPYTCMTVSGVPVCVPPLDVFGGDIAGSDRVGASCNATPGAINTCRSGLCESPATGTIGTCLQGCNAGGGCPPGFGCAPESDGPGLPISLVCRPSGTAAVGAACARGSDCESAICNVPTGAGTGYCARLCADGICPTGMRCASRGSAVGGGVVSACTR